MRRQSWLLFVRGALGITGFVIIALIWLPMGGNLAAALGVLGARVAIASQELIRGSSL